MADISFKNVDIYFACPLSHIPTTSNSFVKLQQKLNSKNMKFNKEIKEIIKGIDDYLPTINSQRDMMIARVGDGAV